MLCKISAREIACKDPAVMVTLMIIEQVTESTCTDTADFTSDDNFPI